MILLEKFDSAISFVEKTNTRLGFVSATFESLRVIAIASHVDLVAAKSRIHELVDDPDFDHLELDWETITRSVVIGEYDKQGPDGILDTVKFFFSFSIPETTNALANALIFISVSRYCCFKTRLKEWDYVIPKIQQLLANAPECELPVEFLRTAVDYLGRGDEEALLALPLELRNLLKERSGEENE